MKTESFLKNEQQFIEILHLWFTTNLINLVFIFYFDVKVYIVFFVIKKIMK